MSDPKEPFVPSQDRPQVGIHPDTPVSELRVRDLAQMLQGASQTKSIVADATKTVANELQKSLIVDLKQHWKEFIKEPIKEKIEKIEKNEKIEIDLVPTKLFEIPDPGPLTTQPIDEVVKAVSSLTDQVSQLSRDVADLKQRNGG